MNARRVLPVFDADGLGPFAGEADDFVSARALVGVAVQAAVGRPGDGIGAVDAGAEAVLGGFDSCIGRGRSAAHDVGAAGSVIACECAGQARGVQFVQLPRSDREDSGGDAAGAVGKLAERGRLVGERERGVGFSPARAVLGVDELDAAGKLSEFGESDFDARRAIEPAAQVAPGRERVHRGKVWQM